jgi:diguanylate cyclase
MDTSSHRGDSDPNKIVLGALLGAASGIIGALSALIIRGIAGIAVGGAVAGALGALVFLPRVKGKGTELPAAAEVPAAEPKPAKPIPEVKAEIPQDRIDQLTSIANANGLAAWFVERTRRLEEDGKRIVVLVSNLDNFDQVEKIRGKATAEAVLVEMAKRVSAFAGDDGIAARTAGDEFVAVSAISPEKAAEFAEDRAGTLAETIGRPVELPVGALWMGGSVGGAIGSPLEGEKILEKARGAFVKARRIGLGRYYIETV